MKLFALLAACIVIGLSGGEDVKVLYGERHELYLNARAEYVYFESEAHYPSIKVNLWTRSKPSDTIRGFFEGNRYFVIEKLTQADNGKYTIRSRLNSTFATYRIIVSPHEKHFSKNVGENIQFDIPMELKSCFVTFTYSEDGDIEVISSNGYERQSHFGSRLYFSHLPLQTHVEIDHLEVQDSGVFKMQDDKNNLVMMVNLEVEGTDWIWNQSWQNIGWTAGVVSIVVSIVVSCCCCLKRCFCKKSSKSSEEAVEPADDPPVLQGYSTMPPPPSYHMEPMPTSASGGPVYAHHPADPAPVPFTAPPAQMYSPAPVPFTAPPAQMYSSVPSTVPLAQAPATGSPTGAQDTSFASNFLSSETDPCFEKKGLNLAPPLYSECVSADVYTSDKLDSGFL